MTYPPNILIVRFSSVGDVLLTTPLIRALRSRHPAATITVVSKRTFGPLLRDNPHLDEVQLLEPGGSLVALARELRRRSFTDLLDLHGTLRSRILRLLVPGPWHGFDARRNARRCLIEQKQDIYLDRVPVAERYFEAARNLDVRPDGQPAELFLAPEARERAATWLADLDPGRGRIALAPGAAHPTKRWSLEQWQRLAILLTCAGYRVVIVGGPEDILAGEAVARAAGPSARSGAGRFDLQESGALLAESRVVVSGDTGLMHMATAVRTPVVALFGPTVEQFGFFPYRARAAVLERELSCRPCSSKGGPTCPEGHHRCLADITPETVAARVVEFAS
jgi:lipopolysaccharide heptosyltransferase II